MPLPQLLKELEEMFGQPFQVVPDSAYRWSLWSARHSHPIHVTMNWDSIRRRATLWIFDPVAAPVYLAVDRPEELQEAMTKLKGLSSVRGPSTSNLGGCANSQ